MVRLTCKCDNLLGMHQHGCGVMQVARADTCDGWYHIAERSLCIMRPAFTLVQLGDLSLTCVEDEVVCRQVSPFSVAIVVPDVLAVMPCLLMASALLGLLCTPETEASSWLKAKAAATTSSCSLS